MSTRTSLHVETYQTHDVEASIEVLVAWSYFRKETRHWQAAGAAETMDHEQTFRTDL
jgi:hypothetical protein